MRLKHHFDTISNLFGRAFSAHLGKQQTRAKLETSKYSQTAGLEIKGTQRRYTILLLHPVQHSGHGKADSEPQWKEKKKPAFFPTKGGSRLLGWCRDPVFISLLERGCLSSVFQQMTDCYWLFITVCVYWLLLHTVLERIPEQFSQRGTANTPLLTL